MKVFIDSQRCRGHARCLTIAPDVFDFLDTEDRAIVRDPIPSDAAASVLYEAARECPEQAITVTDETENLQ